MSKYKPDLWNRCDDCGRLIAYQDFADGKATHRLLEPDSYLGKETWETLCSKHKETSNERV